MATERGAGRAAKEIAMLKMLDKILARGEEVQLKVKRVEGGDLSLVIIPMLNKAPGDLGEDEQKLRAALAAPLFVEGTLAELEAELPQLLGQYADRREDISDTSRLFAEMKETAKRGQDAAEKAKAGKKPAPAAKPAPAVATEGDESGDEEEEQEEAPVDAGADETTNPNSLF